MEHDFWVFPGENFRKQRNILKGTKWKFVFHFFKAIFDTSLVNAILGRNLPNFNVAYHLPKP